MNKISKVKLFINNNLKSRKAAEKIKAGVPYIIRFKSQGREDRRIKRKRRNQSY